MSARTCWYCGRDLPENDYKLLAVDLAEWAPQSDVDRDTFVYVHPDEFEAATQEMDRRYRQLLAPIVLPEG